MVDRNGDINFGVEEEDEVEIEVETSVEEEEIEEEEIEEEEIEEEIIVPKEQVRILKKACLKCGYFVPWIDDVKNCNDDPECPANTTAIVPGRDPKKLIENMATHFAKSISGNNKKAFMLGLRKMTKDKDIRQHIFDAFGRAHSILRLWEEDVEDSAVEI